jgi:toxin ParE1/3/4
MNVRWSQTALAELDGIFLYIYQRSQTAAGSVVERIEELARLLGDFPRIGHQTDEPGVRILPVVRYPFAIFYAIDDATAEV